MFSRFYDEGSLKRFMDDAFERRRMEVLEELGEITERPVPICPRQTRGSLKSDEFMRQRAAGVEHAEGTTVFGNVTIHRGTLPRRLTIVGNLEVDHYYTEPEKSSVTALPDQLTVFGNVTIMWCSRLSRLGDDWVVVGDIDLRNLFKLKQLGKRWEIHGMLFMYEVYVEKMDLNDYYLRSLDVSFCPRLKTIEGKLVIAEELVVNDNECLQKLPSCVYVGELAKFCNLDELWSPPSCMYVGEYLEVSLCSGLSRVCGTGKLFVGKKLLTSRCTLMDDLCCGDIPVLNSLEVDDNPNLWMEDGLIVRERLTIRSIFISKMTMPEHVYAGDVNIVNPDKQTIQNDHHIAGDLTYSYFLRSRVTQPKKCLRVFGEIKCRNIYVFEGETTYLMEKDEVLEHRARFSRSLTFEAFLRMLWLHEQPGFIWGILPKEIMKRLAFCF